MKYRHFTTNSGSWGLVDEKNNIVTDEGNPVTFTSEAELLAKYKGSSLINQPVETIPQAGSTAANQG